MISQTLMVFNYSSFVGEYQFSGILKGYFYINPKLLIETLLRHCLNNFYQKA